MVARFIRLTPKKWTGAGLDSARGWRS
jgi:hypothetical protein